MTITWTGSAPQNYHVRRPAGLAPRAIVLHRSGGSLAALRARFADPGSSVSAHYGVGLDGTVEQYVDEADTAFHAGLVLNPTWTGLRANTNPNFYTIAIELEGSAATGWPETQRQAAAALIADIGARRSIAISTETVIPHCAIRASADCPGAGFPIADVLQRALQVGGGAPTALFTTDEMEWSGAAAGDTAPVIDRTTFALAPAQYCAERADKDLIVLHFTAGRNARGAVSSWLGSPERVATAYLVDPDGTTYETFPPSDWAWHLGVKGGTPHEKRSIGIEIANVGPLQPSADDPAILNWWPKDWKEPYCRRDETTRYVEKAYRGKSFFAAFPDAQADAVASLVHHLCAQFEIPRVVPPASQRLAFDEATFASYKGIATHANFRADKWDVGPAFDWDRLGI